MLLGCGMIYGAMFATGYWIYGQTTRAAIITLIAIFFGALLVRTWKKVRVKVL
jgi:SSS family solute:Na+ symporter